jgi:Leucine-rich repeat (LRR) protein
MGNPHSTINKEALEAISKIKESQTTSLSLRKLGLHEIPAAVYDSKWIQSLDLSSNKLTVLPEGLFSE